MSGTAETGTAPGTAMDADALFAAHERMYAIRCFEQHVQRLFVAGEIPGTTHLCNGQEAICVGLNHVLRAEDVVAGTYRGHGHILSRGADEFGLAAELLGRAAGLNGGRAGSLNVFDFGRNYIGSFAIVGGSIGAATGAALALKGTDRVAVADFGDGTTNHGYFFESLNFAKVYELPIVFSCENNGYMEYTPIGAVTANADDLAARAEVLGIRADRVDGMDVQAVAAASSAAVERARAGEGPQFVEYRTYRFVGHSRSDPATYRPAGELEAWQQRDPLKLARAALIGDFDVPEAQVAAAEQAIDQRLADVFARAQASPLPTPVGTDEPVVA
jgi:acetoin:2,6-dichlorophenolindophenol oxidoreductase subunit alpha